MHYKKMIKKYIKIAAVSVSVFGLLCPQALLAEEPFSSEASATDSSFYSDPASMKAEMISFEKYNEMKERAKEIMADYGDIIEGLEQKIAAQPDNINTLLDETEEGYTSEIISRIAYIKNIIYTEKYTVISERYKLYDEKDPEAETYYEKIKVFSNDDNVEGGGQLLFSTNYVESACQGFSLMEAGNGNFDVLTYSDVTTASLNESAYEFKASYSESKVQRRSLEGLVDTLFNMLNNSKGPTGDVNLDANRAIPVIHAIFAAVNDVSDNSTDKSDSKDKDKTESTIIKLGTSKDDENYNEKGDAKIAQKALSNLVKARGIAVKRFYIDTAPYYKRLMSDLEKAHWLWWQQGIGIDLHLVREEGVSDEREVREVVDEAITYLYENVPSGAAEQSQREEILKLELELRAQYIEPALNLYKQQLKEASSAFCKSIEEEIKPLVKPFIEKNDGKIEVIISLPKESLK